MMSDPHQAFKRGVHLRSRQLTKVRGSYASAAVFVSMVNFVLVHEFQVSLFDMTSLRPLVLLRCRGM